MALAIPKNSVVLITGATGYVGSWTTDEFVKQGYKVRAAARSEEKAQILKESIEKKYGPNKVEIALVPDFTDPNAYDEAIKGVSAVVHIATDVSFEADPKIVVPNVVKSTNAILNRAKKESSVKRFVLTSSSVSAGFADPTSGRHYGPQTWNDGAVKQAEEAQEAFITYAASKVEGERAFWAGDVHFTRNAVLPNLVIGPALHDKLRTSTHSYFRDVYKNEEFGTEFLRNLGPQYYIDARDSARLHVGATIFEQIEDARLLGFAGKWSLNSIIDGIHAIEPERALPKKDEPVTDTTTVNNRQSLEVLKLFGRDGWISFEEALKENIA